MRTERTWQRGQLVPHFNVTTVDGSVFRYATIWQRQQLLLVALPPSGAADCARDLGSLAAACRERDSVCVITREPIGGLPAPAAVIADRWGEIAYVAAPADPGALPAAEELLDWLEHVMHRCPECEGEAK